MKHRIRFFLHNLLLPRGKQYRYDESLHLGWESLILKDDEEILHVLHGTSEIPPKGIVILAHPYLSEASQFYLRNGHGDLYKNMGFAVFIPDFNGFGRSPFTGFDYIKDLEKTVSLATKMYPALPVCMHGISFGASHTLGYACKDKGILQSIIIENCLNSNLTYYKRRNYRLYMFMKSLMLLMPRVNRHHNYVRTASSLRSSLRALLIYNLNDTLTTPEMGYAIFRAMKCEHSMVLMPGPHVQAKNENELLYAHTVERFLTMHFK